MPRGNGTGPAGMGPMTGRAAGYCAGYSVPGYLNPFGGRLGAGGRFGSPAGWNPGSYASQYYGSRAFPSYAGLYRPRGRSFGFRPGKGGRGRR